MTVYVLVDQPDYEQGDVLGVFATEEAAKAYWTTTRVAKYPHRMWIQEFEMELAPPAAPCKTCGGKGHGGGIPCFECDGPNPPAAPEGRGT